MLSPMSKSNSCMIALKRTGNKYLGLLVEPMAGFGRIVRKNGLRLKITSKKLSQAGSEAN